MDDIKEYIAVNSDLGLASAASRGLDSSFIDPPRMSESPEESITDYDRVRQENIARNLQFLRELGLTGTQIILPSTCTPGSAVRKRKDMKEYDLPPRRVQPRRGAKVPEKEKCSQWQLQEQGGEGDEYGADDDVRSEPELLEYDDSSVLQYLLSAPAPKHQQQQEGVGGASLAGSAQLTSTLRPLRMQPTAFSAPSCAAAAAFSSSGNVVLQGADLTAVFSMDFHRESRLFAAGGKGGNVAVFALPDHLAAAELGCGCSSRPPLAEEDEEAVIEPLLAFRAHQRWLSCAKFLSAGAGGSGVRLLTSADDGLVKLWDVERSAQQQRQQTAKLLATSACGHSGGKGIFGLDERCGELVSGSKDRSVCVTRLTPVGELAPLHRYCDLHDSVVKSVSWQHQQQQQASPCIFASGGQDRRLCVKDTRNGFGASCSRPELVVAEAHTKGVHTVLWCPHAGGEHWLLSAGHDGMVHLFDTRSLGNSSSNSNNEPVYTFREHWAAGSAARRSGGSSGAILTPCFLSSARVLLPSNRSGALSVHCLLSGHTVSRGMLSADGSAVPMAVSSSPHCHQWPARIVVAASSRKGAMHVLLAEN